MPLPDAPPRQSLDDSHLVFRRRTVECSSSSLHFASMDSPYTEDITSESISLRRYNSSSSSRADESNDKAFQVSRGPCQASANRPNKNAHGLTLQSQSDILPIAEWESLVVHKRKNNDGELPLKRTMHERSSGSFPRSKGLHSNIELLRPAFRANSAPDSAAFMAAEHRHVGESLVPRARSEKILNCTSFKEKEANKRFIKTSSLTNKSKALQDVTASRMQQKRNNKLLLGSPHPKKRVENDNFIPTRTTSFKAMTVFPDLSSSLKEHIREPIKDREPQHIQKSLGSDYWGDPSKGSAAFQSLKQLNIPSSAFSLEHSQNAHQSIDNKHFQGDSAAQTLHQTEIQQSHAANDFKERVVLESKDDRSWWSSMKPFCLVAYIENLVQTFGSLLSTCLKKITLITAPSDLIIRDSFFVEGSFVIKFRSWITFVFFALWIVSCLYLMLKIFILKMEITRLYGLLEQCTRTNLDIPSKSFITKHPGPEFQENFMKHLRKVSLPLILFVVSFGLKKGSVQLQELSRKYIMGSEEDALIGKRLAYGVDVLFSTHPYMKPTALLLATVLLICGGGFALFAVSDDSLCDAMWRAWTYVADSGNHADSKGTWPRIVSLLISFGGMLIFALMLGLISDAISEKVDSLRKGKSEVIESGHTLILGWSDKLGSLLKQLAIANQSMGGGVVVVLAERDKEEMELDITKLEFNFMGTSVICRSGSPLIVADLKKVSVSKARAIIVLAEMDNADQSDARALRVVLSLTSIKEGLKGHIVVEMRDLDNEFLVKLVGGQMVETVVAHDVIGRLMIQCARQPGLAQIWEDILGFEKAEFYIKRWPELDGMCFGDVLISFPDAVPCGIKTHSEGGRIFINPDDDYVLCEGDEILVIAEDDDTYAPAPLPQVRRRLLPRFVMHQSVPEKILLCGWRRDIQDMIKVLDAFLAPGSELWIFSDVPEGDREKKLLYGNLNPSNLENIKLVHREGNTVIRRHLESLPLEDFDSILILADEKLEETVVNADSSSLATLLLIRDIQSKRLPLEGSKGSQSRGQVQSQSSWMREMHEASYKTIIISEILDSRTKHLVSLSKISDYVLSNELVSMALAMVAEDKQINRVLEELFAEEGNELYIRPAEFYLYDQEEVSFFEIMVRARQREEIVIGYRKALADQAVINPPNKNAIQKWSVHDVFVVLAFEE